MKGKKKMADGLLTSRFEKHQGNEIPEFYYYLSHISKMSVTEISNPEPPTTAETTPKKKKNKSSKSLINLADQVKCD